MKQWSKEVGWLDPTKPPKPPKPEKPIKLGKNETLIDPNDHRRMAIWRRGNRLPMEPGDAEHLLEQDRNMAEYLNGTPEQQAAAKARMDAHRSPEDLAREANDRERIAEMLRKEKEANEALNADYAREEFEGPLYSGG